MDWVTRERPKTDRIACPWLIKNFIDPEGAFLYVPADQVLEVAEREGAISYDAPGARYMHRDGLCTFEVLVEECELADPAVRLLSRIVHGADIADDRDAPRSRAACSRSPRASTSWRCPTIASSSSASRPTTPLRLVQGRGRGGAGLSPDARRILTVQALRAFVYGLGSVLIGVALERRGASGPESASFSPPSLPAPRSSPC